MRTHAAAAVVLIIIAITTHAYRHREQLPRPTTWSRWFYRPVTIIISHRGRRQTSSAMCPFYLFFILPAAAAAGRSSVVFNRIEKTSFLPRRLHIACTAYVEVGIGTNNSNNNSNTTAAVDRMVVRFFPPPSTSSPCSLPT